MSEKEKITLQDIEDIRDGVLPEYIELCLEIDGVYKDVRCVKFERIKIMNNDKIIDRIIFK